MNKQNLRIALLVALMASLALIGLTTQWRFRAVTLKLGGELSGADWGQVFSLFGDFTRPDKAHHAGLVTFRQEAETGPCTFQWATPVGPIWSNLRQESTLEFLMREQLIDKIYNHRNAEIRAGDIVIDVGGHLGTFARFALAQDAGHVVVIEPEIHNLHCLQRTFEDEIHRGTVTLVEAAAWREAGELRFSGVDLTGRVDDQGEVVVRAVTIDDTVAELGLDRVDFIKMDIEGAEVDALIGSREILARFGPRMALSIYHRPEHPQEIRELALAAQPKYRLTETKEFAYFY